MRIPHMLLLLGPHTIVLSPARGGGRRACVSLAWAFSLRRPGVSRFFPYRKVIFIQISHLEDQDGDQLLSHGKVKN